MALDPNEQRALVAVRAGADDWAAAEYAELDPAALYEGELGDEVRRAKAELAVYATSVIRQAMGGNAGLAQRYLDRQASEREVRELRLLEEP